VIHRLLSLIDRRALLVLVSALVLISALLVVSVSAQDAPASAPATTDAAATGADHAASVAPPLTATEEVTHEGSGVVAVLAKIVNFAVLAGILVYFLRAPLGQYLTGRRDHIRRDLVEAASLREQAQAELDRIRQRLAALPADIEALRTRGRAELADERVRMTEATRVEREKLLERTRREIDVQYRAARRALLEHAADLTMGLTRARIETTITPDDQARLIDRYAGEVRS
jgi:F-type H+-transporting ATPase subunit b